MGRRCRQRFPHRDVNNGVDLDIGGLGVGDRQFFNGMVDDVRRYNHALSLPEIQDLAGMPSNVVPEASAWMVVPFLGGLVPAASPSLPGLRRARAGSIGARDSPRALVRTNASTGNARPGDGTTRRTLTGPPGLSTLRAIVIPPASSAPCQPWAPWFPGGETAVPKGIAGGPLDERHAVAPTAWAASFGELCSLLGANRLRPPVDMVRARALLLAFLAAVGGTSAVAASALPAPVAGVLKSHCFTCHDGDVAKGKLDLERLAAGEVTLHPADWEKVIRKIRSGQMPPPGKPRPAEADLEGVATGLAAVIDAEAERRPDPGRTDSMRRLNRTEYRHAIRDLLALDIDAAALLPKDDASHGFDHVGARDLSPTLLNRYLIAAEKISRLAVGAARRSPGGDTYRTPPDLTQEEHVPGLPFGTRGGMLIEHVFPRDGEYEIQVRLTRDRNEHVEGMREPHDLDVLVDGERVAAFTVSPPTDNDHDKVDAHLKARFMAKAGPHRLGVTFPKNFSSLPETKRQPYQARYNMHRHPRLAPAVYQVSVNGPYRSTGPGNTPSRRRVFSELPKNPKDEDRIARDILRTLARRAFRRPASDADVSRLEGFYRRAKAADGFEAGIEAGLAALLASPEFLFRIERDPAGVASGGVYRLDDLALASRLSFFLWSSLPDDELLALAEQGELGKPAVLERQTRRMLDDPRARNLGENFGEQWLQLRNLESITPDLRLFPDFDDNLRQAFRRETLWHLEMLRVEDRSVLVLLKCDETYLDERLAKHYGIPNVYGSSFRRVKLGPGSRRGGLLRQGSVLTVTSYATRTSPVLRGKWVLENILGAPPPPPPGNVPALKERTVSESLPVRERLAEHRANPACVGCHEIIDPPGFALENFDAIGRWRTLEDGVPVDAEGGLPGRRAFSGVEALEDALVERPDLFVGAFTEKLLTFALGRGLEPGDAPAVRRIVREAASERYRFSAVVQGVVRSIPFTSRKAAP